MQCRLCKSGNASETESANLVVADCKDCGRYELSGSADAILQNHPQDAREKLEFDLACWVFHQNRLGIAPRINSDTVNFIKSYRRPSTKERAELYLGALISQAGGQLSASFTPNELRLRVASWSPTPGDGYALATYLRDLGALEWAERGGHRLLANGHVIYEEMTSQRASGSQAFVAMWFDSSMDDAFEKGFQNGIAGAGYEAIRVDRREHANKIDDLIIAEIRRSAFVVADFTGHRGGVYYEAGFAHGLGRTVVFCCRSSDVQKLHFDIRQYNCIIWETPNDIVKPLQNRILALFGAGPLNLNAKPIP